MLSISHDPFVNNAFDHFFKPLFLGTAAPQRRVARRHTPRLELEASENGWTLLADLPGVSPDDVELEVGEHDIKLSYSLGDEAPEGMKRVGGDRSRGKVQRHWRVRRAINPDAVEVSFDKGRLELKLETRASAGPRKIAIHSA